MSNKSNQPYKGKANLTVLFGDDEAESLPNSSVPFDAIQLPPTQPRRYFDPQAMQCLVESVKIDGILQPLLVRPLPNGKYELVAGERRLRAAKEVGLKEVPIIIRELTEQQALQIALVENLQREDLNPVEETEGILGLLANRLDCSVPEAERLLYRMQNQMLRDNDNVIIQPESEVVVQVFQDLGKMSWESFISNRLPLLKLPEEVLESLRQGKIEYTKARAIAKVKDEQARVTLLETAITENWSLTQIKAQISTLKSESQSEKSEDSLQTRIKVALTQVNKSKAWSDPKKQKRLQKLLVDLESLLSS
ncbi:ParB/RepB/Spo0J family partition protein [Planktothrix agardhii]|uniref:ParB/RepB/Spo0J family partition protein n=1 Tax=Planktothrix agardhii TaxID=1160 RepID=UPI0020A79A84|nr:ParB/RepB/Spo0J family partition protein [Planktothrix agardhii]CAD5911118.1 putative plasmid-partitioning protein ParB [Planktothrix agardhii]